MELKFEVEKGVCSPWVLIVPYGIECWDIWHEGESFEGSNCTFMELKCKTFLTIRVTDLFSLFYEMK